MPLSVLVSSAGRRVELIHCLRQSADALGVQATFVACDMAPDWSSACLAADSRFAVPRCTDATFIPSLLRLASEHGIGLIVPTIDTELPFFAAHEAAFRRIGCRIAISSETAVGIARDKWLTAQALNSHAIPVPISLPWNALGNPSTLPVPAILKPNAGSCSKGILYVEDWTTFDRTQVGSGYIVQERLIGAEFTVNCFSDVQGRLLAAIPHRRWEVRGGEVSKAEVTHHPALEDAATRINTAISGLYGPWCFQAIDTGTRIGVFEINARFGGGYPVAHRAGGHFTRWLLEDALGLPNTPLPAWKPGVRMLRYDAAMFAD
jgi:carbamoyl-phosphate synthase large subunit